MGKRRKKQCNVAEDISSSQLEKQNEMFSKSKSQSDEAVTNDNTVRGKRTKLENLILNDTEFHEIPTLHQATKNKNSKIFNSNKKGKYVTSHSLLSDKSDQLTNNDVKDTKGTIKKTKKKKTVNIETFDDNILLEEKSVDSEKKKKKKRKPKLVHDKEIDDIDSQQKVLDTSKNSDKTEKQNNSKDKVSVSSEQYKASNSTSEKITKKRKRKIVEEEVINDEDIDRYCDELDEVHNRQYEDWVNLIEANLKSNKHV